MHFSPTDPPLFDEYRLTILLQSNASAVGDEVDPGPRVASVYESGRRVADVVKVLEREMQMLEPP